MASPHKSGWAQLRVGLMAVAALVILGVLIFLLTGTGKLSRSVLSSTRI